MSCGCKNKKIKLSKSLPIPKRISNTNKVI